MEKDLPSKWREKKAGVAILKSLIKWTLNQQRSKETKKGIYMMVKGSMQQEELTIRNMYAPQAGAPRYVKNKFLTTYKET